ncbi:MAG: hypothetical protein ACRCZB_09600 [Bacteroidales bacterium]
MFSEFIPLLVDKSPAALAVFAGIVISWFIAKFYFTRFKKTEEIVKDIPCNKHSEEIAELKTLTKDIPCKQHKQDIDCLKELVVQEIAELKSATRDIPCEKHTQEIYNLKEVVSVMPDIKNSIRKIEEYIMGKDHSAMIDLNRKFSPYQLTAAGKQLLTMAGAFKCVNENLELFFATITETTPLVALDVERAALGALNTHVNKPIFNEMKDFAYNCPAELILQNDEGQNEKVKNITFEQILFNTSLYLRDKYLEAHKEIKVPEYKS